MISEVLSQLSLFQWALFAFAASMFGASKTGIFGVNMLGIPILAFLFGAKDSTGLLLPILCLSDMIAVFLFKREGQWDHILKLLPWTILGIILAVWLGEQVNDGLFKTIMAVIIMLSVAVIVSNEWLSKKDIEYSFGLVAMVGLIAGFTTMIGNAAGAAMTLYLLAMKIKKDQFIGTIAWFFLIVNWIKMPFHIWIWETISLESLYFDFLVFPFVVLGSVFGLWVSRKIDEKTYRNLLIAMTIIAAVAMLL